MNTRLPIATLPLLLLAGCGDPGEARRDALTASAERAADDGGIDCAVAGSGAFARACTMERLSGPDGTTLTLYHPDGGFRRLLVTGDGRGVAAADGADPATVSVIGDNRIEVEIAGDRYLLPATVKAQ